VSLPRLGRPPAVPALAGRDRAVVAALALGAGLAVAVGTGPTLLLPPLLFLTGIGSWLAVLDLRTHRLPDRIVLSAYPVLLALLGFAAVGTGQPARLGSAVIGGLALAGAYVGLALAGPPGGLGLGDVKLAGLLGLLAGWFGLLVWVTALVAPFLLAAPVAVVALWRARGRPSPPLPLGPFMLAGCLLAVLGR
jgi:leader peptidase (prepilin peptidase)/N-methyltransferase